MELSLLPPNAKFSFLALLSLLSFAEWGRSQLVLLQEWCESLRKEQFGAVLTKIQG